MFVGVARFQVHLGQAITPQYHAYNRSNFPFNSSIP